MPILRRILTAIIISIPLIAVIDFVPYPKSWEAASVFQILSFFITLLLAVTFLFNIFLNYLPRSFIGGLSVVLIAMLQALGFLNQITAVVIILLTQVAIIFFPKIRVLKSTNIPKLKKLGKQKRR